MERKVNQGKSLHRVMLLSALGHLALLATLTYPSVFFTPAQADNMVFLLLNPDDAAARPGSPIPSPRQRQERQSGEKKVRSNPPAVAEPLPVPSGIAAAEAPRETNAPVPLPQSVREPSSPSRAEIPPPTLAAVSPSSPPGGPAEGTTPGAGLAKSGHGDGSGYETVAGTSAGPAGSSGSPSGPGFAYREMPVYPSQARRQGQEGVVLLRLTIDPTGRLAAVEVVQTSSQEFAEAAVAAVKKSTFRPAVTEGRPIPSVALLPVRFSLEHR